MIFDIDKCMSLVDSVLRDVDLFEKKRKGNYNQAGENNNNYKNGISMYPKYKKSKCERCGSTKNLMVHHKDGNRKNNKPSNLQTLCWSCHEKITVRKVSGIDLIYQIKPQNSLWGVGVFIMNKNNQTVMGIRSDNKLWATPGGKVDDNETPIEALYREVKEETGISDIDPIFVGISFDESNKGIWTSFVFVAYTNTTELVPQSGEFDNLEWVDLDNVLTKELFGPTKKAYYQIMEANKELFSLADYLDIQKLTSTEMLVDVKNPGRNNGNVLFTSRGWRYLRQGTGNSTVRETSSTLDANHRINDLKQSYLDYFKKNPDIQKLYTVDNGKFVFPNYNIAINTGIAKDKKSYFTKFKEQYMLYLYETTKNS